MSVVLVPPKVSEQTLHLFICWTNKNNFHYRFTEEKVKSPEEDPSTVTGHPRSRSLSERSVAPAPVWATCCPSWQSGGGGTRTGTKTWTPVARKELQGESSSWAHKDKTPRMAPAPSRTDGSWAERSPRCPPTKKRRTTASWTWTTSGDCRLLPAVAHPRAGGETWRSRRETWSTTS